MMGEKINCITAHTVPKSPSICAVFTGSPFKKSSMSLGSTGIIIPSASMSRTTVTKTKTREAFFATDDIPYLPNISPSSHERILNAARPLHRTALKICSSEIFSAIFVSRISQSRKTLLAGPDLLLAAVAAPRH